MAMYPSYVTVLQQKEFMRIPAADTADDVVMTRNIASSSRAVDNAMNRQFGKVAAPTALTYTAEFDYERGVWLVNIDDLHSAADLAVTVDGVAVTDYALEPANAVALHGRPFECIRINMDSSVQPTGAADEIEATSPNWGWASVPTSVEDAVLLQTSRFGVRRDSPFGIAGSPDNGNELRLLARLDADVAVMLRGLQRERRAA